MRSLRAFGGLFAILLAGAASTRCVSDDSGVNDAGGKDVSTGQDVTTNDSPIADVAPEANPCGTAPTTDFYVNATAGLDSNSGAGPLCAFKTIGAAITASADVTAHANATIHLAAGTYGTGETFPLVLDHGRSLVGAGASTTKIQGSSANYNTTNTGSPLDATTANHFVTLIAGDNLGGSNSLGPSTISNLTILPASTVTTPTANYIGLICYAGNGPNTPATPPLPNANLVVKGVTIGPNFDTGLLISSAPTLQTACNANITTSNFEAANAGILTGGCGTVNPSLAWASAQIGDGQVADANTFTGTAIGVFGAGCGSLQSIKTNKFVSGYRGIVLVSQAAQYFEILGNTFDGSTAPNMGMGINTNATATISALNDNVFTNIAESASADTAVGAATGYAIAMGASNIKQAKRNAIHDNDNGVWLGAVANSGVTFDFSADGVQVDRNQIYCNSKTLSGNGYDVILNYANGAAANFAGNQWNHGSPTTSVSTTTSANGTDVVTGNSGGATLTTSQPAMTTCANGHVP
jgi:hypothetical protein